MKDKGSAPATGQMKQKSIASFFAARSKTVSPGKGKSKPGRERHNPGKAGSPNYNKENKKQTPSTTTFKNAGPSAAAEKAAAQQEVLANTPAGPASAAPAASAPADSNQAQPSKQKSHGNSSGTKQLSPGTRTKRQGSSQPKAVATPSPAGSGSATGDLCDGDGEAIVGRRIKIWWPKDVAWYEGTLVEFEDGKHKVEYDDGDEEWLDLVQERHKLLPAGAGAGVGTAARKRHRKAVIVSESDDDDGDGDGDGANSADDSDFKAGDNEVGSDEPMEDLEAEQQDDDDDAVEDADDAAPGSKRKRPASKAPRKRAAATSAVAALSTPAGATIKAADKGKEVPAKPPSSAGHTPMDRLTHLAKSKSTPLPGFPGFTPPVTALRDNGTPNAKLGLFRAGSRTPEDGADRCGPMEVDRSGSVRFNQSGATGTPGGATTPGVSSFSAGTPLSPPPDSAAKAALQEALDMTPGAEGGKAEPQIMLGVVASVSSDAARFAARMAERFSFLHPDRIKDKAGKRPNDPDYNPRTLLIPNAAAWVKDKKVTEAQQQWWNFKSDNFDSVLLFKVGKFYEMFEMDAFVGVDVLGLQFMKGEQPHAGFPEAAYHLMAEQLARAGYRVLVVEQTETPEQLKVRNAARKPGQKMINVVDRQAVAVLSRGTLMDPEMVSAHPDAAYVLSVVEVHDPTSGHDAPFIGVCALDTAAGHILLGSWRDDEVRLKLRTQLTGLRPVEVVLPRRGSDVMTAVTSRLCRCGGSRGPGPALNELPACSASAAPAVEALAQYFPEGSKLPVVLEQLQQQYKAGSNIDTAPDNSESSARVAEAGLAAFGLMVQFLKDNMLDKALLPNAKYEELCDSASGSNEPVAMELNGAALEGLEILENAFGGPQGSLLGLLDHCTTPFGRRRLRRWLTRPLCRIKDIERRQDAVEELMSEGSVAVSSARRALAGCSDLERCIARLGASVAGRAGSSNGSEGSGFGREAANVVLYEDVVKKRVKVLVSAMKDLGALQEALEAFSKASLCSELLTALTEASRWSDFATKLDELQQAAEWDRAEREGVVRPSKSGVDPAYDAAKAAVEQADKDLQDYLQQVRRELDCRAIKYIPLNKESHVLEVPDDSCRVPSSYSLVGHRKGFKRYSSGDLKELVATRQQKEEQREKVEAGCLQALEKLFVSHSELWSSAIEAVAVVDCLMAIAGAAMAADGQMCRPKLMEPGADGSGVFRATQLRHPAGVGTTSCGSFVPNNITLGGDSPAFVLLTGPNMGGKSTLLRQVCLAAVLAQVGALVPAESLELSPMDGCFVRMGARDAILSGQSTFYIEMAETAAMLSRSTSRSLVALDELGRGTATLDGAAIAAAVLDHMAHKTRCCGLFATHYHQLAAEHQSDPQVAIMHMACAVADQPDQQQQDDRSNPDASSAQVAEVTFLYQLTPGCCPKSYGTSVARLAGLPASVVSRAAVISEQREGKCTAGMQQTPATAAEAIELGRHSAAEALHEVVNQLQALQSAGCTSKSAEECVQRLRVLQQMQAA